MPTQPSSLLSTIPVIDVREGGAVRLAIENRAGARALRDDCLDFLPAAAVLVMPALDAVARRWLMRSRSPYVAEIAQIAAALDFSGVWLLNSSYQWGCTALGCEQDGVPWLVRTLDWPYRGLGRHVQVVRMAGPAGDFFNVTWPGYVGALTAMAPGRFATCINQAPLQRRTLHRWLRLYDITANALNTWSRVRFIPPDQLLRHVCEVCATYAEARRMLESIPVARPVIFSLVGCSRGERCVIERSEEDFVTREEHTSAANDWFPARSHWEGRIHPNQLLTMSFAEAADRSRARREALAGWSGVLADGSFDWVAPPVLNPFTRLAVAMNPRQGILRVTGYEMADADLPLPVTQVREVAAAQAA